MQERSALGRAMTMVADLRERCPWDRVQTRETLRPYLVEEVMELDHALAEGDAAAIREEVADLLLHLAWQLVLAQELAEFSPGDAADDLEWKMKRRHPHLFDLGPKQPWERLKHRPEGDGVLDGLPPALPDVLMAFRLQERAASVGFDWPDAAGPLAKVREELGEIEHELAGGEATPHRLEDEVGDLLFSVVNLIRWKKLDAETVLRKANQRFLQRFRHIEAGARRQERNLSDLSLDEMEALWQDSKK